MKRILRLFNWLRTSDAERANWFRTSDAERAMEERARDERAKAGYWRGRF
jgi:hypothetical protein